MRRSCVVPAASGLLMAAIMLSGCRPQANQAGVGITSTKPAETGEIKLDRNCDLVIGEVSKTVPWYSWQVDYDTGINYSRVTWPERTASAFIGGFETAEWSEPFAGGGCMLFSADSINFGDRVYPPQEPGKPPFVLQRWIVKRGQLTAKDGQAACRFKKGVNYLFCFDFVVLVPGQSQWPNIKFEDVLEHLVGIIEIVPVHDRVQSAPTDLTHPTPVDIFEIIK